MEREASPALSMTDAPTVMDNYQNPYEEFLPDKRFKR